MTFRYNFADNELHQITTNTIHNQDKNKSNNNYKYNNEIIKMHQEGEQPSTEWRLTIIKENIPKNTFQNYTRNNQKPQPKDNINKGKKPHPSKIGDQNPQPSTSGEQNWHITNKQDPQSNSADNPKKQKTQTITSNIANNKDQYYTQVPNKHKIQANAPENKEHHSKTTSNINKEHTLNPDKEHTLNPDTAKNKRQQTKTNPNNTKTNSRNTETDEEQPINSNINEESKTNLANKLYIKQVFSKVNQNIKNKDEDINAARGMDIIEIKDGFKNYTREQIYVPKNIRILLSIGEKFIIPHRKYSTEEITDMITDIENIYDITPHGEKARNIGIWKEQLIEDMLKDKAKLGNKERHIIKAVYDTERFMKEHKDIIIRQSDKGNQTIIMDRKEFEEMANKFMERALNNGLYTFEEHITKENIREGKLRTIICREIALLRKKVKRWEKEGLYKERNERNLSKERDTGKTFSIRRIICPL